MSSQPSRRELEEYASLLEEWERRKARKHQAARGYYDDNGIRQGGLIAFIRYFWKVLEPDTPFVDGWPLWAIAEHLEAVSFGEVSRLLMNVPPGFMKSLCTDVFWPAWEWGSLGKTSKRYVTFSYSASLTERDNERFRDLVISREYQALYGDKVKVIKVGNTKITNTATGWKLASSVGGVGTGERGDTIILDDPHNVKDAESEIVRNETVRWFRESMSNRLNSIETGSIVIIMQRVHEDDVSGLVLSLGLDYCHLMIPMEYDSSRQVSEDGGPASTQIGWYDPRYDEVDPEASDGELAWPERFPPHAVTAMQKAQGSYAWAGQYGQSPAPRGGGIFRREWWQLWDPGNEQFPLLDYIVASLDGAFTEREENDPSALTVWGTFFNPEVNHNCVILIDAWRKFLRFHGTPQAKLAVEEGRIGDTESMRRQRELGWMRRTSDEWGLVEWVAYTCRRWNVGKLLIESAATGISAAQMIQSLYGTEGWGVQLVPARGDKVARAQQVVPMFSQGLIYAPAKEYAEEVITEMSVFPRARHDDLTDSTCHALAHLRASGVLRTVAEVRAQEFEERRYRSRPKALYPC
jgi:predicted phage terminase large subunit-like protein